MKNLRNLHLREAARQLAASPGRLEAPNDMKSLAKALAAAPAPGYYVNMEHGMRMLCWRRRGRLPEHFNPQRRKMWLEIFSRIDALRLRDPRLSEIDALQRVLTSGKASSFFLDETTLTRLLRRHLRSPK